MPHPLLAISLVLTAALAGCATPGTAEQFTWSIDAPTTVDRGTEFLFVVNAANPAGEPVNGVKYHYQIEWPGGSLIALRHAGSTGEREKVRARLTAGPAVILVTCDNRHGIDTKVLEATVEVK